MATVGRAYVRSSIKNYLVVLSIALSFSLLVGTSLGSFALSYTQVSIGLPESGSYSYVILTDLDDDGDDDLVAGGYGGQGVNKGGEGAGIWVFTSEDDGRLKEASSGLPSEGGFGGLAVGDLDGDGLKDIVAAGTSWSDNLGIHVYVNGGTEAQSTGNWKKATSPDEDTPYNSVALEDIDQDGYLDMVAGGRSGVRFWLGTAEGWQQRSVGLPWTIGDEVTGVALRREGKGDDGHILIAAGSYNRLGLRIYEAQLEDGNITWRSFNDPTAFETTRGDQVQMPLMTDFNGDGIIDIVCTFGGNGGIKDGIRAWKGAKDTTGGLSFQEVSEGLPVKDWFFGITAKDIDGDGHQEIFAGSGRGGMGINIWSFREGASPTWEEVETGLPEEGSYFSVDVGDIGNDGTPDIVGGTIEEGITVWVSGDKVKPEDKDKRDEDDNTVLFLSMIVGMVLVAVVVTIKLRRLSNEGCQ